MENLYAVCCGIDVHKKLIVACLRQGDKTQIREFGASTRELLELADWLIDHHCEAAAMESTGSYWKPLYNILESQDLNPIVVNAQHMHNVPGRKTDIKDVEWISDLLCHGLLTPSFIPARAQRELRELVSYRKSLVKTQGAELNRLQKMLEGGNIKLSGTVSNINGKSARHLLDLVLEGNKLDEAVYDQMLKDKKISRKLKASRSKLIDDMNGVLSPMQIKMIREIRKHIDELETHIKELDDEIDDAMSPHEKEIVQQLTDIPGIGKDSAKIIISVIGTDMSRFPTSRQLCSWAGMCPGNNESAKKKYSSRTLKGNKLLKSTLVVCAHSAVLRKESYYSSLYSRIAAHRGKKRAIVAVGHAILQAIYYMIKNNEPYKELGSEYYSSKTRESKIKSHLSKLQNLGVNIPEEVRFAALQMA
ncbi:IS110 family transposase [Erysipelotrichaceae bacterium 66-17]